MYIYFCGRNDTLVAEIDDLSQRVVHCISAEGLVARLSQAKKTVPIAPEAATARKR